MGLDVVELVIEIEEAFDISIPDDRASRIRTVGDVYDYIVEVKGNKIPSRDICLTAATFYRIRRAAYTSLGLVRNAIRPRDSLESTFPRDRRPEDWLALQTELNLKLPPLARPGWLVAIVTVVSIAASLCAGIIVSGVLGPGCGLFAFVAVLIAAGVVAAELTSPFQTEIRPAFSTFRGLSHVVMAYNYAALSQQVDSWNPTDMWNALSLIVAEHASVKAESIRRETSFVRDLGLD